MTTKKYQEVSEKTFHNVKIQLQLWNLSYAKRFAIFLFFAKLRWFQNLAYCAGKNQF